MTLSQKLLSLVIIISSFLVRNPSAPDAPFRRPLVVAYLVMTSSAIGATTFFIIVGSLHNSIFYIISYSAGAFAVICVSLLIFFRIFHKLPVTLLAISLPWLLMASVFGSAYPVGSVLDARLVVMWSMIPGPLIALIMDTGVLHAGLVLLANVALLITLVVWRGADLDPTTDPAHGTWGAIILSIDICGAVTAGFAMVAFGGLNTKSQIGEMLRVNEAVFENFFPAWVRESVQESVSVRTGALRAPVVVDLPFASVAFLDMVAFSVRSVSYDGGARELVSALDRVFRRVDDAVVGIPLVEKIKTIGDAIMLAAAMGPETERDPSETEMERRSVVAWAGLRAALAALGAAAGTELGGVPVALRCGVHSGPVAAGAIGSVRYQFDLWGHTVNVASRLEAVAPHNGLAVSLRTWEAAGTRLLRFLCLTPRNTPPEDVPRLDELLATLRDRAEASVDIRDQVRRRRRQSIRRAAAAVADDVLLALEHGRRQDRRVHPRARDLARSRSGEDTRSTRSGASRRSGRSQRSVDASSSRSGPSAASKSSTSISGPLPDVTVLWGCMEDHVTDPSGSSPRTPPTKGSPAGSGGDENASRVASPEAPSQPSTLAGSGSRGTGSPRTVSVSEEGPVSKTDAVPDVALVASLLDEVGPRNTDIDLGRPPPPDEFEVPRPAVRVPIPPTSRPPSAVAEALLRLGLRGAEESRRFWALSDGSRGRSTPPFLSQEVVVEDVESNPDEDPPTSQEAVIGSVPTPPRYPSAELSAVLPDGSSTKTSLSDHVIDGVVAVVRANVRVKNVVHPVAAVFIRFSPSVLRAAELLCATYDDNE